MGSFGTSSSNQKSNASSGINAKFLPYALDALDRAEQVGNLGYVPYMGNDIAVPDSVVNAWQNTANRSAAFNGTQAQDVRSSMPLQTQNGIQGLSSYGGYQDQLAQLQKNSPAMYDYIKSFAIDPVTGKPGERVLDTAANVKKAAAAQQGGMPQFTLQQLLQQGFSSGGGMGGMAAFMGVPYYSRGSGGPGDMTSAYKQLYDQRVLNGGSNPYVGGFNVGKKGAA
jgi:hypothetical protein